MTILYAIIRYVFILITVITILQTPSVVARINATLQLSVIGTGFHRTLLYDVRVHNFSLKNCHIAVHLHLPSALYVNADELAEFRGETGNTACLVGETDVEIFTKNAKSQNVTICGSLNDNNCQLKLPIHQRYHYAAKDTAYTSVTLPRPKILLGCKSRIREYRVSKVDLCSPCVDLVPKWRELPYILHNNNDSHTVWEVPVGDSNLQAYVTYVTLAVTIFGTFFVVRAISQISMEDHMKRD